MRLNSFRMNKAPLTYIMIIIRKSNTMKRIISLIMSVYIVVTMIPFSAYAADITPEISLEEFTEQLSDMSEEYAEEPVSNRIIVKSKRNIDEFDSVDIVEGYDNLHIVQFDNSDSAEQALEYYENSKYIEYAEEDTIFSVSESEASTSMTYDNHLSWGSETIGVDDYFDYLDDTSVLPEVVIGIVDTGIDLDHEFLKNRIVETGINYSNSGKPNSEDDDNGHGTHVAGIVVDNTTNNVKLKAFKCLSSDGKGNLSNVCLALNAAIESKVDIINMSLGSRGTSELMEDTINSAIEKGITVCVAAGNNARPAINYTPANIENCITVGAINENDQKPLWSNYGDAVDIWAPGSSIESAYNDGGYKSLSGTSMATPFVTAAAALLLSNDKSLKPNDIKGLIVNNSRLLEEPFLDYELYALYIGVLSDYKGERTAKPVFSIEGGIYLENISVEITCDDPDAEIYYSTNEKRASQDNGILYTEPVLIDKVTTLNACAYKDGKFKSLMTTEVYNVVTTDPDENFEIDKNGIITKYTGGNSYLSIPKTINGITVTGIGDSVFRFKEIIIITFPETLIFIGKNAFRGVTSLKAVYADNIVTVEQFGFYCCENLSIIDFTNLKSVGKYSFAQCKSIESLFNEYLVDVAPVSFAYCTGLLYVELSSATKLEYDSFLCCSSVETYRLLNVEEIEKNTFEGNLKIKEFNLPKLKTLRGEDTFKSCNLLEIIHLPSLKGSIPIDTFYNCYNIETLYIPHVNIIHENALFSTNCLQYLFAPQLKTTKSLPTCDNTNIYLSDFCIELPATEYNYNIIAPNGSYAKQYAKENGHKFIPSDSRNESIENPSNVTDLGRSICASAAGVRFGFTWDNINEVESLASDIEYGFIYSQKGAENLSIDTVDNKNIKKTVANNRVDHGDTTSFNLVISNIPKNYYDRKITARAYVCIDGMYFYSNIRDGSFNEISGLVLADDEIDMNTKNAVKNLINA